MSTQKNRLTVVQRAAAQSPSFTVSALLDLSKQRREGSGLTSLTFRLDCSKEPEGRRLGFPGMTLR